MNPAARVYHHHARPPFYMAAMPPPPQFYYEVPVPPPPPPSAGMQVRAVWACNLDAEFDMLRQFARDASYVAVSVHYPGLVHHAGGQINHNALTADQRYALLKANVDDLKPLQVGLAVCNRQGHHVAWEFNLRDFDRRTDLHDPNSLAYLAGRGLDVDTLRQHGIDTERFADKFRRCGLIGRGDQSWVAYSGAYHVAYLLKIITGGRVRLPPDMAGFIGLMRRYLGEEVYDVARTAADCRDMPVGLERVTAHLGLAPRSANPGLAGAACVRVLQVFRTLMHGELGGNVERYRGLLQGLQC